mmetsp:Transcript_48920/g.153733  ORF Transcript_48920/g.153733 Transcript_48920/m.153733 type:complete len:347 (+) Transcript_48920:138-1178(+)
MLGCLLGAEPADGILVEKPLDEVHSLCRDLLPPALVAPVRVLLLDLPHDVLVLSVEGRVAAKKHPGDDSEAPQIALVGVALATENVRADVGDGPTRRQHQLGGAAPNLGKAKIDELQLRVLILALVQEILELEIAMDHVARVEVAHSLEHLPHGLGRVGRRVDDSCLQPRVQLTARAALHEEADSAAALIDTVQLGDVRVAQGDVDLHLSCQLLELRTRTVLADSLHRVVPLVQPSTRHDHVAAETMPQYLLGNVKIIREPPPLLDFAQVRRGGKGSIAREALDALEGDRPGLAFNHLLPSVAQGVGGALPHVRPLCVPRGCRAVGKEGWGRRPDACGGGGSPAGT